MQPRIMPPDATCDGWRVQLEEEGGLPVYVTAGTGASREDAIRSALRETFVLLAVIVRELDRPAVADSEAKAEALHRACALFLAGQLPVEGLARACAAMERAKR